MTGQYNVDKWSIQVSLKKKKDAEAEQKPKKPGEAKRSVFLNNSNSNVFGGL